MKSSQIKEKYTRGQNNQVRVLELYSQICEEINANLSHRNNYFCVWKEHLPETPHARDLYTLDIACVFLSRCLIGHRFLTLVPRSPLRHKTLNEVGDKILERYSKISPDISVTWFMPSKDLMEQIEYAFNCETLTLTDIGACYLELCPLDERRSRGKFYTPEPIARYILSHLRFTSLDHSPRTQRLIDPSCGDGIFLSVAAQMITAKQADKKTPADIVRLIQSTIHGFDNDPIAIHLARFRLFYDMIPILIAMRSRMKFKPHIHLADALNTFQPVSQHKIFEAESTENKFNSRFDFVVGNPPYGKIKDMPTNLRKAYSESLYGHPNIYGIFFHLGLELLKPGGMIGYIVPKSFTGGLYFKNLRRMLIERTHIRELLTFTDRQGNFPGVLQENLILIAQARDGTRPMPIRVREVKDIQDLEQNKNSLFLSAEEIILPASFDHIFFTAKEEIAYSIKRKVFSRGIPLRELGIRVSTGQFVWNRRKTYLFNQRSSDTAPLVWSHNIRMFEFLPDRILEKRPPWVQVAGRTEVEICHPRERIIIKRMTAKEEQRRIIAARVPKSFGIETRGYFIENHLNFLEYETDSGFGDLLLAIMNSRLIDFLFRMINGNTQVSATELRMLPIVVPSNAKRLSRFVTQLEKQSSIQSKIFESLQAEIYKLYGLTDSEVCAIESYYAS